MAAALTAPPAALARHCVVKVNGDVITDYDVEQRTRLTVLTTHQNPGREAVVEELIDDTLKAQMAKRYQIDLTDTEVDAHYADLAKRMHLSTAELTQVLTADGVDAETVTAKIRSDLGWQHIFRSRRIPEQGVSDKVATQKNGDKTEIGYDYTLRGILFVVPRGDAAMMEDRRQEAEALRARFAGCDAGLTAAQAQRDVVIRAPVIKHSSDFAPALRKMLNNTGVGHLTPPEVTENGVELFALCDQTETPAETPEQRAAREKVFLDAFQARFTANLRRQATIARCGPPDPAVDVGPR